MGAWGPKRFSHSIWCYLAQHGWLGWVLLLLAVGMCMLADRGRHVHVYLVRNQMHSVCCCGCLGTMVCLMIWHGAEEWWAVLALVQLCSSQ